MAYSVGKRRGLTVQVMDMEEHTQETRRSMLKFSKAPPAITKTI
jgi:hypothetical protein